MLFEVVSDSISEHRNFFKPLGYPLARFFDVLHGLNQITFQLHGPSYLKQELGITGHDGKGIVRIVKDAAKASPELSDKLNGIC